MNRVTFLIMPCVFLIFASSCSGLNLKKEREKKEIFKIGVVGFKITAPIRKLGDLADAGEKKNFKEKDLAVEDLLKNLEKLAKEYFVTKINSKKIFQAVSIPDEDIGIDSDYRLNEQQASTIQKKYHLGAVIIGQIPWYGKTNPWYPFLGMTADIALETVIIGLATKWNSTFIFANIGLELLTGIPLWYGGAYLFGSAFRPVTINAQIFTFDKSVRIQEGEVEVFTAKRKLKMYPKDLRKNKSVQLEAALKKALDGIIREMND